MRNFLLTLEYDGSLFHGWQRQPGKRTVQGQLESVLSRICLADVRLDGASRTDAGVHAYGQSASFGGDFAIPPERLKLAANNLLGAGPPDAGRRARVGDVRVADAREVPDGFHARYDAVGKKYIYRMLAVPEADIFMRNACWQVAGEPDAGAMAEAAARMAGVRDFRAFRASGGAETGGTVREVLGVAVYEDAFGRGGRMISIEVTGAGFLYNMVRIMAGTLLGAGMGRISPREIDGIIESGERGRAGPTAPPQGLCLAEVYYGREAMKAAAATRFARPCRSV
ncbi:MAG: tRNA pseudouridine(38-40) synthase TruA [Clostridiales Family XIII bacterium]|jgi:tRNA pseudouridine38-40 synthase|nr:tRNA pseudouridine(38-40) synthase TruA [Clostridiales Family XIII bacterium]